MNEILIDVTRVLGRSYKGRLPTGVDRVCLAYVHNYGARARAMVHVAGFGLVLPKSESAQMFRWLLAPRGKQQLARILFMALLKGAWRQRVAGQFLLNVGHTGLERDDYPRMLQRLQVKPIFFIHDLIPISHPEFCRAGERDRHLTRINQALAIGHGCITNSQATLNALLAYAQEKRKSVPASTVAPLAPGALIAHTDGKPMVTPYFVILGTIEPRKNHWMILQIWRDLIERFGTQAPRLFVIGQRGWECESVVDMLERCDHLRGFVIERSDCSDAELAEYMLSARALLFPSFAEGYGLPLVEALSMGVPVIASELDAFKEIAGPIPEYADALDGKRWAELIMKYSRTDSPLRLAQNKRLEGYVAPTWPDHFAEVDALLAQLNEASAHA
jgi:glycosyltransferase involved in cell wall biosynthesis